MRVSTTSLQEMWFENEDGSKRFVPDFNGDDPSVPAGFVHMITQFPCQLSRQVTLMPTEAAVAACSHPNPIPDLSIIDSHEGQQCSRCNGRRTRIKGEAWEPWAPAHSVLVDVSTMTWPPQLVLAMVRPTPEERQRQRERWNRETPAMLYRVDHLPGPASSWGAESDGPILFGLSEAIIVTANSCERCWNVLIWTYGLEHHDDPGYPEMSERWKRAGTSCMFCSHLGFEKRETNGSTLRLVASDDPPSPAS